MASGESHVCYDWRRLKVTSWWGYARKELAARSRPVAAVALANCAMFRNNKGLSNHFRNL
jgi:hypothetical protein